MVSSVTNSNNTLQLPRREATQTSTAPIANTADTQKLHEADSKVTPENRVITFDFDGAVVNFNKLSRAEKKAAKKDGSLVTVDSLENGSKISFQIKKDYLEKIKALKAKGHKIIFASTKLDNELMRDMIQNSQLSGIADAYLGQEEFALPDNFDYKKYPNHPSKISFGKKLANNIYRYTIGPFKYAYDLVKSKLVKDSARPRFMPPPNLAIYPKLASYIAKRNQLEPSNILITSDYDRYKSLAKDFDVIDARDQNWDKKI